MTRPTPRRPASSRGPVSRPRKIAGQAVPPAAPAGADERAETPAPAPASASTPTPTPTPEPTPSPEHEDVGRETPPVLASPGVTRMLLTILAVLAALVVLQLVWWVRHEWFVDEPPAASEATGAIAVPADRPVLANELAHREGVEVAARAVEAMMSRSSESYDADVDKAAALMTDSFAEEFRSTTDDVKESFIAGQAQMSAEILAQTVVRANDAELQALIFFDQSTTTAAGDDPKTVKSAYRALVTMIHTEQGWYVEDLDAR